MKTKSKLIFLAPLLLMTACGTTVRDPVMNPRSLNDQELLREKIVRVEQLEREMERREAELKYQHLKELTHLQMQQKNRPSEGHVSCKFFCF
jgi:sensor histidine kinase YesM